MINYKLIAFYCLLSVLTIQVIAQNGQPIILLRRSGWHNRMDTLTKAQPLGCAARKFYTLPGNNEKLYVGFMGGNIKSLLIVDPDERKAFYAFQYHKIAALTFIALGTGMGVYSITQHGKNALTLWEISFASFATAGLFAYLSERALVKSVNMHNARLGVGLNYFPGQNTGVSLRYSFQ